MGCLMWKNIMGITLTCFFAASPVPSLAGLVVHLPVTQGKPPSQVAPLPGAGLYSNRSVYLDSSLQHPKGFFPGNL